MEAPRVAAAPSRALLVECWRGLAARERTVSLAVLAAATVVGAAIRFATLGSQSLWADESVTVTLARKSFSSMLRTIPHTESTPPLYYILEWFSIRVFGSGEVGARMLSAVAGTLTIPLAYVAARALLQRRLPAAAVAFSAAVNPVMVWYSQEARSYALYVLFDAAALMLLARALQRPTRANLGGWAAASALGIVTHYFGGFFALASAVVLVARVGSRVALPAIGALAPGILVAPLAAYQLHRQAASSWIGTSSLGFRLQEVVQRYVFLFYNPTRYVGTAIVMVVGIVLAWRARRSHGARVAAAVVAVAGGLPLLLAAVGIVDVFYYRNVLAIWLPLAILCAAGLPSSRVGAVIALAVVLPSLVATLKIASDVELQRDSWRPAVATMQLIPGRKIVVSDYLDEPYTLPIYWPALKRVGPGGVRVREIDLVGHYVTAKSRIVRLPAFRTLRTIRAGNLTIARLVAPSPRLVRPSNLPPGGGLLERG